MTNELKNEKDLPRVPSEDALEMVKQEIYQVLSKSPRMIREYTKHLLSSQGKYIRAVSVLTCAEDEEGYLPAAAIKIAAAIELLHLATLVHDDIIDNAKLRRGSISLQKKYGKRTAVICGDYLLSVSLRLAASIENKKDYIDLALPDYIGRLCLGELNQYINNGNVNLSTYQYLKIISGKTAALFEASFYTGAVLSGCGKEQAKRYRQLGYYIGMIFQLTDDCIDFEDTVEKANKPVQSDYEQGVITLPLIHAFSELDDFKGKALEHTVTRAEINEAVTKTGGIGYTRLLVRKYYKKAGRLIEELEASPGKKEKLTAILDKASRLS